MPNRNTTVSDLVSGSGLFDGKPHSAIGVTGFEPAASWSRTKNTRNPNSAPESRVTSNQSGNIASTELSDGAQAIPNRNTTSAPDTSDGITDTVKPPKSGFGPVYKVNQVTGCWLWQRCTDKDGYPYFRSNGKVVRAHRYYFELNKGPIPEGTEVDHLCQNRGCVNPAHLEAVSHLANVHRGRRCTHLNFEGAQQIRALKGQLPYRVIAERFGISHSLVAHVMTNRVWTVDGIAPGGRRQT